MTPSHKHFHNSTQNVTIAWAPTSCPKRTILHRARSRKPALLLLRRIQDIGTRTVARNYFVDEYQITRKSGHSCASLTCITWISCINCITCTTEVSHQLISWNIIDIYTCGFFPGVDSDKSDPWSSDHRQDCHSSQGGPAGVDCALGCGQQLQGCLWQETGAVRAAGLGHSGEGLLCGQHALGSRVQGRHRQEKRPDPRNHLQPGRHQSPTEVERSSGTDCPPRLLSDLPGKEESRVEWRRTHLSELRYRNAIFDSSKSFLVVQPFYYIAS